MFSATHNPNKKVIQLEMNYSENLFLIEALSSYRFEMEREFGKNSEEEKYIGELLHATRNPRNIG